MLTNFSGLASTAAATALNPGQGTYHALKLLEAGRGVIASHSLDIRTDTSDFEDQHPELAERFIALRDELDSSPSRKPARPTAFVDPQLQRVYEAERCFNDVIAEIHARPGFGNFLCLPTADGLMAAASADPIAVINVTQERCDAFLIDTNTIRVLSPPRLHQSDINQRVLRSDLFSDLLEWLWNCVAHPVLNEMGFQEGSTTRSTSDLPRMWWIPTGSMSRLPSHAAGRHYERRSHTVIDRVVSSYSPTIKALLYSRKNAIREGLDCAQQALLVSMPKTPSNHKFRPNDPRFAKGGIRVLDGLLASSTLRVMPERLLKETLLRNLGTCTMFHFAGHGKSDALAPSKSCLLLDDGISNPLTMEDLAGLNLYRKPPWLAYLSPCSTGESQVEILQDEAIHLMSACLLAGFQHVVGSLWEIDDELSVDAAREFYNVVRDRERDGHTVALGVHNAALYLRDKTARMSVDWGPGYAKREEGNPFVWAAYIHVGP